MENYTTRQFTGEVPEETIDVASLGVELKLVTTRKLLFNQDLGGKYLEMEKCPWERNLKDNHVVFLAQEMKKGTFRPELTKLASCYCHETNKEYRINGQHTNWSRLKVSEQEYPPVPIECLKYEAKTLNDVRRLYASFDRGTPRTKSNVIFSYLQGTEQFSETTPTVIRALAEGFAFWKWDINKDRQAHTGDDIAFLLQTEYKELTSRLVQYCEETPKLVSLNYLRKASVIASMFETFSCVHGDSVTFWNAVKTGVGMGNQDDPRLRLRNTLMTSTVQTGGINRDKKVLSSETIYRYCVSAFNSFRSGESVKAFRVSKKRVRAK